MKKKISFITLLLLSVLGIKSQKTDTLNVHFYENYPFAYTESGTLVGIEIDIIQEYINWLKKKGVNLVLNYRPYAEFSTFYNSVKEGDSKTIGLGSVTLNSDREKDLSVSAPYIQNVAVLVSSGSVPTIRSKSNPEVTNVLGKLTAMVVKGSSHERYLNSIKEKFVPGLKVTQVESQNRVLEAIVNNPAQFGYVDIIAYWSFLKKNPGKYIKMQKVFNEPKENLGFIMPKSSAHLAHINEFFESGFGFTATKMYHQILEKYLGHEIIESVELK